MRRLLATPLLLAACLDSPPDGLRDGGAAVGDGSPGESDATSFSCPGSMGLALTSEADIVGWTPQTGVSCSYAVTGGGLEFVNDGEPSSCRLYRDQVLDLRAGLLAVRLNDADPNLSMAFSIILGPPGGDLADRRWLYFERDEGLLLLGECLPGDECDDARWGSLPYSSADHIWLRFNHVRESNQLLFETSVNTTDWDPQGGAEDVTLEDVYCIAIDLGSYEQQATGGATSSSFSDLAGGPPAPALTPP